MNIISIMAVGIIGTILTIVVKQYKPEFAIFASIITVVIILSYIIGAVLPIISDINSLLNKTTISFGHLSILIKTIGICYLTQFICDICKDSGQTAISNMIEIAGKVAICIVSLPLFRDIISTIENMIGKVT